MHWFVQLFSDTVRHLNAFHLFPPHHRICFCLFWSIYNVAQDTFRPELLHLPLEKGAIRLWNNTFEGIEWSYIFGPCLLVSDIDWSEDTNLFPQSSIMTSSFNHPDILHHHRDRHRFHGSYYKDFKTCDLICVYSILCYNNFIYFRY